MNKLFFTIFWGGGWEGRNVPLMLPTTAYTSTTNTALYSSWVIADVCFRKLRRGDPFTTRMTDWSPPIIGGRVKRRRPSVFPKRYAQLDYVANSSMLTSVPACLKHNHADSTAEKSLPTGSNKQNIMVHVTSSSMFSLYLHVIYHHFICIHGARLCNWLIYTVSYTS